MFYSHDILTDRQHGVATIWLVATVGPRGGGRKVTRKAIQEVDVRKACEAIIGPGAPMALRLQGNLLYGVSRVYSQQCAYVLNDAEKVQSNMKLFYRLITHNETDPEAGRARPEQNILEDDPKFIANPNLPRFDFGDDVSLFLEAQSQASSMKAYSQLSPIDKGTSSSRRASSLIGLNLPQSQGSSSLGFPSPFGPPSSAQKTGMLPGGVDPMDGRDDLDLLGALELDIDADGNVLGIVDQVEDDLPPLPSQQGPCDEMAGVGRQGKWKRRSSNVGEADFLMMEDQLVPDADAFPQPQRQEGHIPETGPTLQQTGPTRKRRGPRVLAPDDVNYIPSALITAWNREYLATAESGRHSQRKITPAQAREFAYHITIGQGIGGIGRPIGVPGFEHPLARHFSGDSLRDQIFGRLTSYQEGFERTFSQAFEDDEAERGRNVRPRLEEATPPPGQGHDDHSVGAFFGDDFMLPEIGMEGQPPMDSRMSSSLMPWNRTPPVQPPSSALRVGSRKRAESHQVTSSPKGRVIHPIERYSDAATTSHHGSDPGRDQGLDSLADAEATQDSQWIHAGLDTASGDFLTYLEAQANEIGAPRAGDRTQGRLWVNFEDIAIPGKHSKNVAAQAFLHVLTLATKNRVGVNQVVEGNQPFGIISLGVDVGDMRHMDDIYDHDA